MKKQNKAPMRIVMILTATLVTMAAVWVLAATYDASQHATQKTIDDVSDTYLQELSEISLSNLSNKSWSRVNEMKMIASAIEYEAPVDSAEMDSFLKSQQEASDLAELAVLDSSGGSYTAGQGYKNVCTPEIAREVASQPPKSYAGFDLISANIYQVQAALIYFVVPIEPISFNGVELVAIICGLDAPTVDKSMGNDVGWARSSVITKEGTYVVFSSVYAPEPTGNNLFGLLSENAVFEDESSLEGLIGAVNKNDSYMASVDMLGNHEYIYLTPIPETEWYLSTVMPYRVIDEPIGNLTDMLMTNRLYAIVGISLAALVFLLVYFWSARLHSALLQEEKRRAEDALEIAKHADMAKSEFLSRMSHEIRTPLNGIIGMTNIALNNIGNDEKVTESLGKVAFSSEHLLSLINDVLDMSKIESGQMKMNSEPFDFKHFIESLTAIYGSQANIRGVGFETILVDEVDETIIGDSLRLNQILYNLISNALKFTPEKGLVKLRIFLDSEMVSLTGDEAIDLQMEGESEDLQYEREWLCFSVIDTGPGIEEGNLEIIFNAFEQENSQITHQYGGTGLGLPIAKQFAEMMGGSISVESVPDEGSIFTVRIPYVPASLGFEPSQYSETCAVVLDMDPEVLAYHGQLLKRLGISTTLCTTATELLDEARKKTKEGGHFDLYLVDVRAEGIERLDKAYRKSLKKNGTKPRHLILTTFDLAGIEGIQQLFGNVHTLRKPLFISSISAVLEDINKADKSKKKEKQKEGVRGSSDNGKTNKGVLGSHQQSNVFKGKRLLVAEDNELNLEIMKELLNITGAQIDIATNGKEALECFENSDIGTYDAIFMDVQMPVLGGYEATKALRALERSDAKEVFVFAMTANAFAEDVQKSLDAGMNCHLSKPIDIELVYKKLNELFDKSAKVEEEEFFETGRETNVS